MLISEHNLDPIIRIFPRWLRVVMTPETTHCPSAQIGVTISTAWSAPSKRLLRFLSSLCPGKKLIYIQVLNGDVLVSFKLNTEWDHIHTFMHLHNLLPDWILSHLTSYMVWSRLLQSTISKTRDHILATFSNDGIVYTGYN